MGDKVQIYSDKAPQAVGPYSQAVSIGGWLYISGQVPLDPATGRLIEAEDIRTHTCRVLDNLSAVLAAAGVGLEQLVKTTIFLVDLGDFAAVNEVYGEYLNSGVRPARSTIQVAALPLGARIEIEAVAYIG